MINQGGNKSNLDPHPNPHQGDADPQHCVQICFLPNILDYKVIVPGRKVALAAGGGGSLLFFT
jgi:hypothetical protein